MQPNIIPSIFTAINQLSGPVKRMGTDIANLGLTSAATMARMERSFARVNTAAMGIAASGAGIAAGILVPLGLATHAAIKFEEQMGNVGTLIDTTKESLDGIGDGILELSKKIPKPISDLSTGMYQIRSAGIEAGNGINQAFGVLKSSGKLAVTGLSTTTEAVNAVTSAMNVFKDEGLSSQEIANSFFKTVQGGKTTMAQLNQSFGQNAAIMHEAGVSLLEMNAATAALTITGISASQAQVELAQSVTALIKPSTNLQKVYDALGYSGETAFKDIVKASGGLVPAMQTINAQARKMGVTMGEDFGNKRALVANIELTGTLNEQYKKMLATQKDGNDVLSGKFAEQSEKGAAQMKLFENTVTRLGISLGGLLIPALNHLTNTLTPVIDGISSFAKEHKTLSGIVLKGIGYFGLAAAAISGIGFAVGTVTKAFGLWKLGVQAYNYFALQAAFRTGRMNMQFAATATGANGAAAGVNNLTAAIGKFTSLGLLSFLGIDWVEGKMHDNYKEREKNKNKIDFTKPYNEQNPNAIDAAGLTEHEYNIYKKEDSANRVKYPEWYKKDNGNNAFRIDNDEISDTTGSDKKSFSSNSVPFIQNSSTHDITITLENKTGLAANVNTATGGNNNRANRVQVVVNSTTSRNKPATA